MSTNLNGRQVMQALEGIRVLDLTRMAPGPYCTMLLGDMGADILRVEEPTPPTSGRRRVGGAQQKGDDGRSLALSTLGRNKRSIGLNLRHSAAREIFYRLAEDADVIVEGFRPGVVERLGVDYKTIARLNPRIVYCSLTGYGQSGPYSRLAGHDINYISLGGALSLIGESAVGRPTIPLNLLADFAGGGAQAAFGILCALLARERTGQGQLVDVAMADGVVQLITSMVTSYYQSGEAMRRGDHLLSGKCVHYNVYQCRDGKWLSIGSLEPYFYENFCKALGREEWLPHQYADEETHRKMIAEAEAIFRTRDRDEWFDLLNRTDQCAMRMLTLDELANDPQLRAREMIVELEHPEFGVVRQTGFTPKLSATPGAFRCFAPSPGQHTLEVLGGLGFTKGEIDSLREQGAIS